MANADSPKHSSMLMFAVSLHNLPEGMAVGVIYVGLMLGNEGITAAGALAVSIGIAIQNFPEGAIISMPLRTSGKSKPRAFVYGVLSGIIEPIGAVITILFAWLVVPLLPYLLSFAAGSMLDVVVAELVPEMYEDDRSHMGTWMFSIGFAVMMPLAKAALVLFMVKLTFPIIGAVIGFVLSVLVMCGSIYIPMKRMSNRIADDLHAAGD